MLNANPCDLATYIFSASNITIKNKVAIIAACLYDKKHIDLRQHDPKERSVKLLKAIRSLENLIKKKENRCL